MLAFRNDRFSPSGTDGLNPLSSTGASDANLTSSGHAHTQERHRRGPSLAEQVADQLMAHDAIGAHARDELGFAPNQNPVFVEVTSDADWATGIAFPAGRLVNTTFESFTSDEERREAMSSLGHHPHAAGRHSLAMLGARAQPHIVSSSVALPAPMQRREEHRSWSFPRAGAASVARSATKSQVHRQLYMPAIAPSASDNQGGVRDGRCYSTGAFSYYER